MHDYTCPTYSLAFSQLQLRSFLSQVWFLCVSYSFLRIYSVEFLSLSLNSCKLLALQLLYMLCDKSPPSVWWSPVSFIWLPTVHVLEETVNSWSLIFLSIVLIWLNPTLVSHFLFPDWRVLTYMINSYVETILHFSSSLLPSLFIHFSYILWDRGTD